MYKETLDSPGSLEYSLGYESKVYINSPPILCGFGEDFFGFLGEGGGLL